MRKLRLVSLFSGAGGLDAGFHAAGFTPVAGVEFDEDCCKTLAENSEWPVLCRDSATVHGSELRSAAGMRATDEVHILIGGPPCQPFSKAAYWSLGDTRRLNDPRAGTLSDYMRLVEELQPAAFVLENVHGINYSGKEEGFQFIENQTREINKRLGTKYVISWRVVNAADYGVPQLRHRFFMVAVRSGQPFRFPQPTHFGQDEQANGTLFSLNGDAPYATAWDAIGGGSCEILPHEDLKMKGQWAGLLPSIPEGENYLWHTNRRGGLPLFGWRTRYWSFLLKLAKNRPSWTIQAQPGPAIGPFHWENRLLSTNELAAIQTFPKGYRFVGGRGSIQKQIGNAVPSLLGEVIAREVIRQVFGRDVAGKPSLAVERRQPVPEPEKVKSVPRKFRKLAGDHADHPGTGKGKGAKRQLV